MAEPAVSQSPADGAEASVGDLATQAVRDVTRLIRCELDLAKLELRTDARRLATSVVLVGMAFFSASIILVLISFGLVYGLIRLGIWPWAAFLIVAGVYALLAGLAVLIAYLLMRRIGPLRRTRDTVRDDLAVLRQDEGAPAPAAIEAG
jgi:uncharacterized membrane protein YqjE